MNKIKRFSIKYLNFNTSQKAGIAAVLIIVLLLYFLPDLIYKFQNKRKKFSIIQIHIDTFKTEKITHSSNSPDKKKYKQEYSPFYFDPNTVDADELRRFGLPEYVICNFTKYRNSGAKFKTKSDFKKIYGLKPEWYSKIEPYIKIEILNKNIEFTKTETIDSKPHKIIIELNSADSSLLIKIKGIGPYLASKIIKYRNALGGFSKPEQLYEIYNVKKEMIDVFISDLRADITLIKKININIAEIELLKKHPYFSWKDADAIVKYRRQHGFYQSIEDLKKIILIKPETIEKIEPYLEY